MWNLCHSHGLIKLDHVHPLLRVEFVLDNLQAIWDFRESGITLQLDPALDFAFRIFPITLTAVEVIVKYGSSLSSKGRTFREELLPYVKQCLTMFLQLVSPLLPPLILCANLENEMGSYTMELVRAMARIG